MATRNRFIKQPSENLDYDFNFSDWFASSAPTDFLPSDTASSVVSVSPSGLTLGAKTHPGANIVKQYLSGGTNGTEYEVTCVITTTGGRVKEAEIVILVLDTK